MNDYKYKLAEQSGTNKFLTPELSMIDLWIYFYGHQTRPSPMYWSHGQINCEFLTLNILTHAPMLFILSTNEINWHSTFYTSLELVQMDDSAIFASLFGNTKKPNEKCTTKLKRTEHWTLLPDQCALQIWLQHQYDYITVHHCFDKSAITRISVSSTSHYWRHLSGALKRWKLSEILCYYYRSARRWMPWSR